MGIIKKLFGNQSQPSIVEEISELNQKLAQFETVLPLIKQFEQTHLPTIEAQTLKHKALLAESHAAYQKMLSHFEKLEEAKSMNAEVDNLIEITTKNLGAYNAVIEMELKDADSHLRAINKTLSYSTVTLDTLYQSLEGIQEKLDAIKAYEIEKE